MNYVGWKNTELIGKDIKYQVYASEMGETVIIEDIEYDVIYRDPYDGIFIVGNIVK